MKKLTIDNDTVYLKKSFGIWKVVKPWRDPDTKEINWFNFFTGGSWLNLIFIIIIVAIIIGVSYEYSSNVELGRQCLQRIADARIIRG